MALHPKLVSALKLILFLSLGFFLLWLVTKDVSAEDWDHIFSAFANANYFWIGISIILSVLSHISRAIRWNILFEPLGHTPKTSNSFFAVMIGYMANYALPRLGEVTRCGVLATYEKIPLTQSIGTVVVERVVDVLCMLIVFLLMVLVEFDNIRKMAHEKIIDPVAGKLNVLLQNQLILFTAVGLGLSLILLGIFYRKRISQLLTGKIGNLVLGLWQGVKSIKDVKRPVAFIAHSIFIWLMYFFGLYVCFFSFKETSQIGLSETLAVFVMGTIGVIFTPGGIGAYQALVTQALTSAYMIPFTVAFAFSWIVWTSQLAIILMLGIISLIALPLANKHKTP